MMGRWLQVRSLAQVWTMAPVLLLGLLAFAGCGEDDGNDEAAKTSGLPGELKLTSLADDQRQTFCEWFEATLPSEETCPRRVAEDEEPPTCLDHFEQFGSCTVEEVERCFASAFTDSCELPDTEACKAFLACQENEPPTNFCPDAFFTCVGVFWTGDTYTWPRCWSWSPFGCDSCTGFWPTSTFAKEWCEEQHPEECKNQSCWGFGDVLID